MMHTTESGTAPSESSGELTGTSAIEKLDWQNGKKSLTSDHVIDEVPIALVYNGISHVVMMATPTALEDFALGFSLSEGILDSRDELLDFVVVSRKNGIELQLTILASRFEALKHKRRNLTGRTGCGLCGVESLEQAVVTLPEVDQQQQLSHKVINSAVAELQQYQPLQLQTGASHGAAWCDRNGNIGLVREDAGRHNALDKLLGALAKRPMKPGFILVTSRASYEMVAKTARMNIPLLASLSAPTSLAIKTAEACGMTLVGFCVPERHVVYCGELT